ncbi:DUF485 domain-containing protein [Heyndrickxia sporothermodurans]
MGRKTKTQKKRIEYEKIASSVKFKKLISAKKKFIIPLTIFFLVFYFALPFLTSYSNILNNNVIGDISWAWLFAFAQFIMTWVLCTVYVKKASFFDKLADEIIEENLEKGEKGA